MSANDIDAYLADLDPIKADTLEKLRKSILAVVPDAEQTISYAVPAFKVDGKAVAGFAAFKNHLSYLPHSSTVLNELADELSGYKFSKGALQFPVDAPLPDALVARLIEVRRAQIG